MSKFKFQLDPDLEEEPQPQPDPDPEEEPQVCTCVFYFCLQISVRVSGKCERCKIILHVHHFRVTILSNRKERTIKLRHRESLNLRLLSLELLHVFFRPVDGRNYIFRPKINIKLTIHCSTVFQKLHEGVSLMSLGGQGGHSSGGGQGQEMKVVCTLVIYSVK